MNLSQKRKEDRYVGGNQDKEKRIKTIIKNFQMIFQIDKRINKNRQHFRNNLIQVYLYTYLLGVSEFQDPILKKYF